MTTAIQFLRSSQESLRPNPTTLADGMPMLNTSGAEPGLFFKTDDGGLTKIGPCAVGPDAPNINAQGFEGNSTGEMWLDTSGAFSPRLRIWTGEAWTDGADVTISDNQTLTGQKTFTQAIIAQGGVIAVGEDITAEGLSLSGVGYSAPTTSSMADTALTTKGYVDSVLSTGSTVGSLTAGEYIEGTPFNGSFNTVWDIKASHTNVGETVVARDEDGNFSSNEITAVRFIGDGSLLTNLPGGGGGGGGGNYLPLTGGNLSGDLILSTDRIILDATNGSATFASGDITLNANGNITAVGQVSVGGSSASPNIRLETGGNIKAEGAVRAGGDSSSGGAAGAYASHLGFIAAARDSADDAVWRSFTVGDTTEKISMTAGGNIIAAGYGIFTNANGCKSVLSAGTKHSLQVVDQNSNNKVTIDWDGSAEFAGAVDVGTFVDGTSGTRIVENGTIYINGSGSNAVFNANAGNAEINADGSGTFAGDVAIGGANTVDGNNLTVSGSAYFFSDTPAAVQTLKRQSGTNFNSDYLQCRNENNTAEIVFAPGGTATFTGNVTAGGYSMASLTQL